MAHYSTGPAGPDGERRPGAHVPAHAAPGSVGGAGGLGGSGGSGGQRPANAWRTGFIVLAVIVGLAVIGAVVWGIVSAVGAQGPDAANTPQPTVTVTETTTPTEAPTPTAVPLAACPAGQVTVTLGEAGGAAGSTQVPLIFTNTGAECTMQGFPQVAFVGDDNGTQLGAAAVPDSTSAVASFDLATGDSVQAALTIEVAENFPDCDTAAANGFRVFPPNDSGAVFVPTTDYTACTNTGTELLKIGAVQQN
ncbi:DUF4232 domain-containing protein [Herbiconiux sp. YIM B11900]|uniref:DUF4232 domain-containing protein n=1 Tax=Herbiconiux sp. YIM B11900 TaxID=3404131 RepID=UPI003F853E87